MTKSDCEYVNGEISSDQLGLGWISGITRWDTTKAVHTKPHRHRFMEMIFCLRGELPYSVTGHGSITVSEGSGVIIPGNTTHFLGGGTDLPCERIGLHIATDSLCPTRHSVFSAADLKSIRKTLDDMAGIPFRLDTNLQNAVRELSGFLKRPHPITSFELGFIRSLCCGILFRTVNILRKPLVAPRTQMMEAAVDFINQHYSENFNVEDLTRFIGYGRTRLFTLFKRHTGLTPNEYLVRLRIRKARELLERGNADAGLVARSVGFNDPAYFKTVYLRYTGTAFTGRKPSR